MSERPSFVSRFFFLRGHWPISVHSSYLPPDPLFFPFDFQIPLLIYLFTSLQHGFLA